MSAATECQSGLADAWMRGVESGDAREASISRSATCVAAWCLLDVARLIAPERPRARGGAGGMEQPLPQRAHLRGGAGGRLRAPLQLLKQDIGGRRQQDPELIGPEAHTTGPVQRQPELQLLDAILHVAAGGV